jgi:hypothetical protein
MPSNKRLLSLIDQDGQLLWQQEIILTERVIPEDQYKKLQPKLYLNNDNHFIIAISATGFSTRYIALQRNSGKISWFKEV